MRVGATCLFFLEFVFFRSRLPDREFSSAASLCVRRCAAIRQTAVAFAPDAPATQAGAAIDHDAIWSICGGLFPAGRPAVTVVRTFRQQM